MYNDSEKISASEINKFAYCPYSWYYERRYGRRHIRKLYLKRLETLGLEDSIKSNLIKGQRFHNTDFGGTWRTIQIAVLVITVALIMFLLFYFLGR